jgi:hypothetical protein
VCLVGGILDRNQLQTWAQRDVVDALKRTALAPRVGDGVLMHILKAPTDLCALERLGFKPKAKVSTTWTAAHKQRLKNGLIQLALGTAQMPTQTMDVMYYLSHHVMHKEFDERSCAYMVSRLWQDAQEGLA